MREHSLLKNSIYNIIYKSLNLLFPLISATYVARVLSADGIGRVAYAQNIVAYFTTIAALGIPNYGIREIAKTRDNQEKRDKILMELFLINVLSTVACLVCYYAMIFSIGYFRENRDLYIITGLAIFFNFFSVDWFYQGNERYKYIATRSFIIKIISLAGILLFVRKRSDFVIYALINCLAIGGNGILNIVNIRKFKIKFVSKLNLARHMKSIFILMISVIMVDLYSMVDTTMIGLMRTETAVGYYANTMKLIKLLVSVITAISAVLLPRLSYYYSQKRFDECEKILSKTGYIIFAAAMPCAVGLSMTSNQVMPILFGKSFAGASDTLKIGSFLVCLIGLSNLFGTQVLMTCGQEKKLLVCTGIGAVINILLNFFFIPIMAQNGAAIASVISETTVVVMTYKKANKYIHFDINHICLFSVSGSTICMGIVIFFIQSLKLNDMIKFITSVVAAIVTYIVTLIVTGNPVVNDLLSLVKKTK